MYAFHHHAVTHALCPSVSVYTYSIHPIDLSLSTLVPSLSIQGDLHVRLQGYLLQGPLYEPTLRYSPPTAAICIFAPSIALVHLVLLFALSLRRGGFAGCLLVCCA